MIKIWSNFQIPHNVPTRLAEVGEKSYSHDSEGTDLYKASFVNGLRLSLNYLTRKLLRRLGVAISQLAPNTWRAFVGAQVLRGVMSDGWESLSLYEFLYYYKPLLVPLAKGVYYFKCRKKKYSLVTEIPSSNRDRKEKFFFICSADCYVDQRWLAL